MNRTTSEAAEPANGFDPNMRLVAFDRVKFNRLGNALKEGDIRRKVVENLPRVISGALRIDMAAIDRTDSFGMLNHLITKEVKLGELMSSMEKIRFEYGAYLLGKPMTDIQVITPLRRDIGPIRNGHRFELTCQAEGFPTPYYEFYKDGVMLPSEGSTFVKASARLSDSGIYECRIIQRRWGELPKQVSQFCTVTVEQDDENEKLKISVGPTAISLTIGHPRTILKASVNESDLTQIKFLWFKLNEATNVEEAIMDNPTATTDELVITDFKERDSGRYKCQATRECTKEIVMSIECAHLYVLYQSEFDLKIALLMGTGNYHEFECAECTEWLGNVIPKLHVHDSIARLKDKLEKLGYLVLAFADLDAESYLRFICLFREICEEAENVSVFIYVAGHGHNYQNHDYLIPNDIRSVYHQHNHQVPFAFRKLGLCSLENLLGNFQSTERTQFTVTCFWDLCRTKWIDMKTVEGINNDKINFSIIFSCNVGKSAYEILEDMPELHLKRGSILLSVFLNKLRSNESFYSVISNMNEEITSLRNKNPKIFEGVTGLRLHSTMPKTDLTAKATNNGYFARRIDSLYLRNQDQRVDYIRHNDQPIGHYRYMPDTFINCLLLEIKIYSDQIRVELESLLSGNEPLGIERVAEYNYENDDYLTVFRVKSVMPEDTMRYVLRMPNHHIRIHILNEETGNRMAPPHTISLPNHVTTLYTRLYNDAINLYVEDKKHQLDEERKQQMLKQHLQGLQVDSMNDAISIASASDVDIGDVDTDSEIGEQ